MCAAPAVSPCPPLGPPVGPSVVGAPTGPPPEVTALLMDTRTLRPFKSSEEYLYAMREDLAEWLAALYPDLQITVNTFMDKLEDGVALCKHANHVRKAASEHAARRLTRSMSRGQLLAEPLWPAMSPKDVQFRSGVKPGTFLARDNVSNFITWCRHDLGVLECLLFETDDLILRKNEKHVVLCLMEVARQGAKFGVPAPMLVQFEREIDREIARDQRRERAGSCSSDSGRGAGEGGDTADLEDEEDDEEDFPVMQYGPVPQIVTNDLKSLDEMVRDLVERCTCPTQFPMIRVSEGKYRIGDTKVLIFVRILRKHVMVRVGGGWDTLSHYLDKHDPCRCRAGHRGLLASRLVTKSGNNTDLNTAQVHYDRTGSSPPRTRRSSTSSVGSGHGVPAAPIPASPQRGARQRSRSPRPPHQAPQRRSRSPRPPVTVTAASDSGSEVSDEGYRSLNHKLLPLPGDHEAENTERPESAMTNTSDCSSSTPDEAIPPPRRIAPSRRSASPCVRPDSYNRLTPTRGTGPLPRSRSVSGDPESNSLKSPLSRTAVGYRSARARSSVTPPSGNPEHGTWNGPRSTKSRPAVTQDTFQPFGPPSVRRSLPTRSNNPSSTHSTPSRKPSRSKQQQANNASLPTSPSKQVSPLLQQILTTSEETQGEEEFLKNLKFIIAQYESRPEDMRPAPRKSSHDDNDTRIPVPTFYKQTSKGSLLDGGQGATPGSTPTTCCL